MGSHLSSGLSDAYMESRNGVPSVAGNVNILFRGVIATGPRTSKTMTPGLWALARSETQSSCGSSSKDDKTESLSNSRVEAWLRPKVLCLLLPCK
ncbi:hypothetical protein CSUI_002932 [Cystoisospora suis]|uniref:Uncharacterized protein n=1 Tax=Cystoisospora suis TaxID=483139 RepID=A0A2C6L755_9APIC|nr:hypothetical protein CSUI_002932 [Cystoisospora suis]